MWFYAFVFASRESINRIGDEQWMSRSEAVCAAARMELQTLARPISIDPTDTAALAIKAGIVDAATDVLERAVERLSADEPADDKGRGIVPLWLADWRVYLEDRRNFADALRTADRHPYFAETEVEGVPVSERVGKFARENDMRSCQPPTDLSV
jgi:hypothetical protein